MKEKTINFREIPKMLDPNVTGVYSFGDRFFTEKRFNTKINGDVQSAAEAFLITVAAEGQFFGGFAEKFFRTNERMEIGYRSGCIGRHEYTVIEEGDIQRIEVRQYTGIDKAGNEKLDTVFKGSLAEFINRYAINKELLPVANYNGKLQTYPKLKKEFVELLDRAYIQNRIGALGWAKECLEAAQTIAELLNQPQSTFDDFDQIKYYFAKKEQEGKGYYIVKEVGDLLNNIQEREEETRNQLVASSN